MPTATTPNTIVEVLMREFEDLFREHAGLVFGTACEVTGNREDGEDVVQTVFLRLLRRGLPPKFQKNSRAYLYRAAIYEIQEEQTRRDFVSLLARTGILLARVARCVSRENHGIHH